MSNVVKEPSVLCQKCLAIIGEEIVENSLLSINLFKLKSYHDCFAGHFLKK
jgi:hypothetical protein